jgi:hypothetical protein
VKLVRLCLLTLAFSIASFSQQPCRTGTLPKRAECLRSHLVKAYVQADVNATVKLGGQLLNVLSSWIKYPLPRDPVLRQEEQWQRASVFGSLDAFRTLGIYQTNMLCKTCKPLGTTACIQETAGQRFSCLEKRAGFFLAKPDIVAFKDVLVRMMEEIDTIEAVRYGDEQIRIENAQRLGFVTTCSLVFQGMLDDLDNRLAEKETGKK